MVRLFRIFKSGMWFSISEPVYDRGAHGCGCGEILCVMLRPYIDFLTTLFTTFCSSFVAVSVAGSPLPFQGWTSSGLVRRRSGSSCLVAARLLGVGFFLLLPLPVLLLAE